MKQQTKFSFMKKQQDVVRRNHIENHIKAQTKIDQLFQQIHSIDVGKSYAPLQQYQSKYGTIFESEQFQVKPDRKLNNDQLQNQSLYSKIEQSLGKVAGESDFDSYQKSESARRTQIIRNTIKTQSTPRNAPLQVNVLIEQAVKQINQLECEKNKIACGSNGHSRYLDGLSKGRIILSYLQKRRNPQTNRFYQVNVAKSKEATNKLQMEDQNEKRDMDQNQDPSPKFRSSNKKFVAGHFDRITEAETQIESNKNSQFIEAQNVWRIGPIESCTSNLSDHRHKLGKDKIMTSQTDQNNTNKYRNVQNMSQTMQAFRLSSPPESQYPRLQTNIQITRKLQTAEGSRTKRQVSLMSATDTLRHSLKQTAITETNRPIPYKLPQASIKQLYNSIDAQDKLTYRNLQPRQTRILGGNFVLALDPNKKEVQLTNDQNALQSIIDQSTHAINTIRLDKFINKKENLQNWIQSERNRPVKFERSENEPTYLKEYFELVKPNTLSGQACCDELQESFDENDRQLDTVVQENITPHCSDLSCKNCLIELLETVLRQNQKNKYFESKISVISAEQQPVRQQRLSLDQLVAAVLKLSDIADERARKCMKKETYTLIKFKDYFKKLKDLNEKKKVRETRSQFRTCNCKKN